MRATTKTTGPEWCSPTAELENSKLLKLVSATRHRTAAHDAVVPPEDPILLDKRARRDSGSGKPLADAWFVDSSAIPIAPVEEHAAPVSIEGSGSRFKLDPPPPIEDIAGGTAVARDAPVAVVVEEEQPVRKRRASDTRQPSVYPVYKASLGIAIVRVMIWLVILGGIGAGALVMFGDVSM